MDDNNINHIIDEYPRTLIAALRQSLAERDAEIERLREAQRWIPVGERLPEDPTSDDDDTFICLIRGISFYGDVYLVTKVLRFYGEKFYSIGHFSTDWTDQVVAWMPLPEPPQEDDNENNR